MTALRFVNALGLAAVIVTGIACDEPMAPPPEDMDMLRPRSNPIEFVGLTATREVATEADVLEMLSPIFGDEARAGRFHRDYELQPGLFLTVMADARTTEQVVVQLEMVPAARAERRTVLRVPASLERGSIFIETVRAALARTAEVSAFDENGMHDWHLEYQTVSANGGFLELGVTYDETTRRIILSFSTENPRTSLEAGLVNTPAFEGDPWEKIAGTVFFELSRDEFGFFSNRAYGTSSGAEQNFEDFQLEPHNWLRLTVTPEIEDEMVDVAFEVVTLSGARVPVARAPASYLAGDQFRENVFRMVDNMVAKERERVGSSTPFRVPFHYDDPEGGGVVRVIAEGEAGQFRIAYSIETPSHRLRDVDFVPYVGDIDLTPPPTTEPTCADLGSRPADSGRFAVTFTASDTVRASDNLLHPLRGNVYGSVFRAEDVTITGPREGAVAVADIDVPGVDIADAPMSGPHDVSLDLPAGDYQILGFMDIDNNAVPGAEDPDVGDPLLLPIGAYSLECARQPITVEFALLLPEGY